jgi:glycerate kinase
MAGRERSKRRWEPPEEPIRRLRSQVRSGSLSKRLPDFSGMKLQATANGKLPWRVSKAARLAGTRCVLLSGSLGEGIEELETGFAGCFAIASGPADVRFCMDNAAALLEQSSRRLFRLIAGSG